MVKGKNFLLVLPEGKDYLEFCSYFTRENYTRLYNSEEEAYEFLCAHSDIISVIVIDIRLARASHYEYVRKVGDDPRFVSIPIIAVSADQPLEEELDCFKHGVSDFITAPCPWELMSMRIFNAIRAKDSATFYEIENMLEKLPCNIYLKDTEGKYVFCTHYWDHLDKPDDPNWTIRGKTDMDVRKDKENAKRAYESDMNIIKTKTGTSYVIEENTAGKREYLELVKEPIFDEEGNVKGIVAIINDVTELQTLRKKHKRWI